MKITKGISLFIIAILLISCSNNKKKSNKQLAQNIVYGYNNSFEFFNNYKIRVDKTEKK